MRSLKTIAMALLASTLMVGCSDDQSAFRINSVEGKCTIQGQIVYNQGTTYEDGKFVYNYKPVANTEVFVTVDNADYNTNLKETSVLKGTSVFKTTTDESGNYSIEIPATDNNMTVTITTPDFLTERTVTTIENNQVVSKKEVVVMRGHREVKDIHSHGIRLASFKCIECNKDEASEGYNQYATLNGKIGLGQEFVVPAEKLYDDDEHFIGYKNAERHFVWAPAQSYDLIVTVKYDDGNKFTYNTTTDNEGNFSLQVPVQGFPTTFEYEVSVLTKDGKLTHYDEEIVNGTDYYDRTYSYRNYVAHELTGYYKQKYLFKDETADYPVAAEVVSKDFKAMVFRPLNNGQDKFHYDESEFTPGKEWLDELKERLEEEKENENN